MPLINCNIAGSPALSTERSVINVDIATQPPSTSDTICVFGEDCSYPGTMEVYPMGAMDLVQLGQEVDFGGGTATARDAASSHIDAPGCMLIQMGQPLGTGQPGLGHPVCQPTAFGFQQQRSGPVQPSHTAEQEDAVKDSCKFFALMPCSARAKKEYAQKRHG